MTRHRSPAAQERYKAYQRKYNRERLRKHTPEQDFMANLREMGKPTRILELVDSAEDCALGLCPNSPAYQLLWWNGETWESVIVCREHETQRQMSV